MNELDLSPTNISLQDHAAPVLDRELGLRHASGDEKLFIQLLRDFKKVHFDDVVKLKAAMEAGERYNACRLAHTLKSSSAIIGCEYLSGIAYRAEKSLEENAAEDMPAVEKIVAELEPVFESLVGEINNILAREMTESEKHPFDREKALALTQKLLPLLKGSDSAVFGLRDDVEEVFTPFGEEGEELLSLVDEFEFPKAAVLLSKIADALGFKPTVN